MCATNYRSCGGVCAACPTSNAAAFSCSGSACVATSCYTSARLCSGACRDLTDPLACGSACMVCPVPANGTATCSGPSCNIACNTDFKPCGGVCASCPNVGNYNCSGTQCVPTSCATGYHLCGMQCLSSSSPQSCGSSCSPCAAPPANATATCSGNSCGFACNSGYMLCGTNACCPDCRGVAGACTAPAWCTASGLCGTVEKLDPAGTSSGDKFGAAVAIDGNKAVVGSPGYSSGPPMSASQAGTVYIYDRQSDGSWQAEASPMLPPNAGGNAGAGVAISGVTVVVGATGAAGSSSYVYFVEGGTWSGRAGGFSIGFGASVAIAGDRALVGAPASDPAGVTDAGSASVYERPSGGAWQAPTTLVASDATAGANWGSAVSMSGDRALVGARGAEAVYVLVRQAAGTWPAEQKLTAMDATSGAGFGSSVSLDGDRALVGAPNEGQLGAGAGAGLVFYRQSIGMWLQVAKLVAPGPNGGPGDQFGASVSLSGDLALVGAPFENGTPGTGGAAETGAAYVFKRQATGEWGPGVGVTVAPNDTHSGRDFGAAVAVSGTFAVIGAPNDVRTTARTTHAGSAYFVDLRSVLP
jgi:hypothetical protein